MQTTNQKHFIFDNNCTIGAATREKVENYSPEDLLRIMDEYGIQTALCTHTLSEETSIRRGEKLLLRRIGPYRERFEPKAVYHPLLETPAELFSRMKSNGCRSVKIFVEKFNLAWIDAVFGQFFGACARRKIPVWVDCDQVEWRGLSEALSRYPNLRLVIEDSRYSAFNMMTVCMSTFPNLYLDISRFNIFNGYQVLKETLGLERVLFGSALPKHSPGAPLHFIYNSEMEKAEMENVLGKNLKGLLEQTEL